MMDQKYTKAIIFLLLVILPVVIYWQTTAFSFVWDDKDPNLLENRYLQNPTAKNILHFWKKPYAQMYIPLTYSAWAFIKYIGSLLPFGEVVGGYNTSMFHFFNILFHIFIGLLIYSILQLLFKNRWAALLGAVLFLVHPLQVETVAWVTEFRGLLSAFFGFSALYIILKTELHISELGKRCIHIHYVNALLLYLLGLLSKPSVMVIPLFIFLFYIFYCDISFMKAIKKLVPFIIISIPFIILLKTTQTVSYHDHITPLWGRPLIMMDSINFYLLKTIIPYPLVVTYTRTFSFLKTYIWFYFEWIIPIILLFLILKFSKKNKALLIGFLIFIFGLLPVSGLIPFVFQKWSNVADRYMYFSMFGVAYVFCFVAYRYLSKKIVAIFIIILVCLTLVTAFIQIPTWKNSVTLWSHALTRGRPNAFAFNNRGAAYNEIGEYEKSIQDLNQALKLDPENPSAYNNRGYAFYKLDEEDLALVDYDRALLLAPDQYEVYINRGNVLKDIGDRPRALEDYKQSLIINSNQPKSYYNLGLTFAEEDSTELAIQYYSTAIAFAPGYDAAYLNRGIAYAGMKQYDKALKDYEFVININPKDEMAYNNRGIVYLELCQFDNAEKDFSKAISLNPIRAQSFLLRGKARKLMGNIKEALEDYNYALELEPEFVDALYFRAILKSELDDIQGAIQDTKQALLLEPDNVKALILLGDLSTKMKNFSEAELYYTIAISLDPEDGSLYQKRAVAYFFLEEYNRSQNDVEQAIERGVIPPDSFLKALNKKQ